MKKLLIGGIIGGIVHFFLGWLVWGILLNDFFKAHSNPASSVLMRGENDMIWWALVVGSLAMGFLVSYVLLKSGVSTVSNGAITAGVIGLLLSMGMDCIMYAQMKFFGGRVMAADIIAATVVMGIIGAIIGWYFGRGKAVAL